MNDTQVDGAIEAALAEGLGPGEVMAETAIQQAKRSPTLRRWAEPVALPAPTELPELYLIIDDAHGNQIGLMDGVQMVLASEYFALKAKYEAALREIAELNAAMAAWHDRAVFAELELTELKQDRENWERIGQS